MRKRLSGAVQGFAQMLPSRDQSNKKQTPELRLGTIALQDSGPLMDTALALREAILENLQTRKWRAGHRIPTERELSGQYGLSRSAVRRVLADMKDRRLITQTVGSVPALLAAAASASLTCSLT